MSDEERALRLLAAAEAGEATPETAPLRRTLALLRAFGPGTREACPGRDLLVDYAEERLAPRDREPIAAHLAACPFCAAELADYRALAKPPRLELAVRLARDGLHLLAHSFGLEARAEPALARGQAAEGLVLGGDTGLLTLDLRLNAAAPEAADVRLRLRGAEAPLPPARVNLFRGDDLLESHVAAEAEELVLAEVAAGSYRVSIEPRGAAPTWLELRLEPEPVATP